MVVRHGVDVVWSPPLPWKSEKSKLSGPWHEMMSRAGRSGWANELPCVLSASKGGCQDQRSQASASLLLIRAVPHHLHGHICVSCAFTTRLVEKD